MEVLLKGKDVKFTFTENLIIISRNGKEHSNIWPDTLSDVIPSLKGKITDADDKPIPGATVVITGTQQGTITAADGDFVLYNVKLNSTLLVSSIGFETRELPVKGASVLVKLNVVVSDLDETVIIAYGTTTKRLNTGNVSTVDSKELASQPVSNPLAALTGRIPGMFITQNTGVPGGGFNVLIRGRNSITNGIDPFYVIDGVPYTSQLLPNQGNRILQPSNGNLSQGAGNPLSFISPSDIESISVLKDADATAIYGSRGANGVILITTKKGKPGKSQLGFNISTGISKVSKKIDLMNTQQYLQIRREAFKNDGVTPDQSNAPDLLTWDTTRSTDWQKALIGGTAHYTDVQASLSGGTANTQYLIGGNYHRETTVFPGRFSDQKSSAHFNISNISTNQKFKATLSGRYLIDDNHLPSADFTNYLSFLPSHAPDPYNSDGSLNWSNYNWGLDNPFSLTKRIYNTRTNNLIGNLNLSYQLLSGLEITSNFGYTNMQVDDISTLPLSSLNPLLYKTGTASFTDNNIRSWIIEPQITYRLTIGKNKIDALVGTTFQQNTSKGQIVTGSGYTSDALLENIQAAPVIAVNSVTSAIYKYNAVFARLNYNRDNKYILNLTARRDGSSRFGDNNKFHNFGSVGAAWIFSQENFIQKSLSFLSFGKLRTSYGTTGNDQIGDYRFYDLFNPALYSYQGTVGLTPTNLYNPGLAWEETRKLEAGLDLGFLKDRILLNGSYYRNRSSNQLLFYTLSTVTGFPSIPANFPAIVQNTGLEFSLSTTNVKSNTLSWSSAINLTIPRNKLVAFPNIANTSYQYTLIVGQPLAITKAFHLIGVNDTTGVYEFADSKGAPTSNPISGTDNTIAINTAPEFYGGFSNTISYKGFQLDFAFQFTKQRGASQLFQSSSSPGMLSYNPSTEALNRWKSPGDKAPIQQFTQSYSSSAFLAYYYASQSDYAFTDASYIRLKTLSLSYHLPAAWTKKMNLQNCRIYILGQNLFTITKYKGIDPESQRIGALPPLRVITGGIELSL
jgi:TonB-linked SusC/RagA family outer membrane protein